VTLSGADIDLRDETIHHAEDQGRKRADCLLYRVGPAFSKGPLRTLAILPTRSTVRWNRFRKKMIQTDQICGVGCGGLVASVSALDERLDHRSRRL
jgi:hypothetical protein